MISEDSQISNLSTEKQDDGDIRCPKCSWYFSSITKPYILPCFHNLCDKCINNLINQKSPKCPLCSKIFTSTETNTFQVNFSFLNIVIKILANKIIFCKRCYKIYYWIEHSTTCNQENFIEADEILNDIRYYCKQGIQIIKSFGRNKDNNSNILIKFKNEILNLLVKLVHELRKKNINETKKVIEQIFSNYGKEKNEFNYKAIKNNIINFLLLCMDFNEYFDKNDIIKTIWPFTPYGELSIKGNKILTYRKNKNDKITKKNNSLYTTKNKIIKNDNNFSCENTTKIINNNENNVLLFTKTPTKKKLFFENESSRIYKIKEKALNKAGKYLPLSKFKNKIDSDNKENNQIENQNIIESEEEFIDNFDDDYYEYETELTKEKRKNITDINYTSHNKLGEFKNNRKFNKKNIFEKSLLQETEVKKKLILGLGKIKVISLKKNTNKSNSEDINKNKIKKNKHLVINTNNKDINSLLLKKKTINENKFINPNNKLINDNKNNTCKKVNSIQSNILFSSLDLTQKNKYDKNIKPSISPKINEYSKNHICYLSPSNINPKKIKNKINLKLLNSAKVNNKIALFNSNAIKKKPFINTNNINNMNKNFSLKGNNNKTYININNSSNDKNRAMNKILNNFNNIKDIVIKINKYLKLKKYISNNIHNNINQNLSLLSQNISNDYNLLLDDINNNFCHTQRKYLFSFKNNTKFIILFDTEYNKFIPLDLGDILPNKFPNFNSSMQFEFVENITNFLLFITGGNDLFFKDKNDYSSNSFIILNIKINMTINSKNKINYKKKYTIEYKDKMPLPKSHHSILFFDDNLYVIGGFDNNKNASNECFYFSFSNKEWHELPKLNYARGNSSICLYNKSLLYVFKGRNNEGLLKTIEYLNLKEKNNFLWKIINVVDWGYVWNLAYNSCNVVLEENKILIFGGEDETKLYKESFLFDIKNNNIYRGMDLKIPAAFNGQGIYDNKKIYGFDFKNKNGDYEHKIHIFDIKNNFWTLINARNDN